MIVRMAVREPGPPCAQSWQSRQRHPFYPVCPRGRLDLAFLRVEHEYASVLAANGLPQLYADTLADMLADADRGLSQGELETRTGDLRRLLGQLTTPLAEAIAAALTRLRRAQSVPVECCPNPVESLHSPVVPAGQLVVVPPAPRAEHRPHEDPALADQVVVRARIMRCDFFWGVGNVKLDRPAAAGAEVYEQRPSSRAEQVARVRLAVQQLLAGARAADRAAQPAERAAEEFPVGPGQRRTPLPVGNLCLRTGDSIGEVRRRQVGPAQGGVQPHECARVVGWRDLRSGGLVVCPERDGEAIPRIDPVSGPGFKLSHRAIGFGETAGDLYLEFGVGLLR
jgi:hypothetical protein